MPFLVQHVARTIVVFSICAASAMASAEIHRCKDDRGQTVLSDRPCGAAFSGQALQSTAFGGGADRIAAPSMPGMRTREAGGSYDFIPVHRPGERRSEKQALR